MRTYSVAEADERFEEMLARVKAGETVIVTEDGAAVAALSPASEAEKTQASSTGELARLRSKFQGVSLEELVSTRHEGHKY